jgi:hypothetical protein
MPAGDIKTPPHQAKLSTLRVLVVAALGMGALLALIPAAGHDQLWFLLMAERWLHGATLYGPEIFDSNTPAIVWLSAIPAAIANATGCNAAEIGKLLVTLLGAVLALVSVSILSRIDPSIRKSQKTFLAFAFISLWMVAAARDFGQRDHLTAMLCTPYVLLAATRKPASLKLHLLVGLLAAAGVCLKPQQALVPLVIEAALLSGLGTVPRKFSVNWKRPEPAVLILIGAIFVAAIAHFSPLYFSAALPTLLSTYWAIGHLSVLALAAQSLQLHFLGLLASSIYFTAIRRRETSLRNAIKMLLVAGLAATAAFYYQGTGWYYQQLPAITFFGLAVALEAIVISRSRQLSIPTWTPWATSALGVLAIALTIHYSGYPFSSEMFSADRRYAIETPDPSFFRDLPAGTAVATLTTSVDDAMMPVARYRLTWAQRTNNLWTLPAILRAKDGHAPKRLTDVKLAQLSAQQRLWMLQDFERWRPTLVLVARCQSPDVHCQELEDRHDNLLAFFLADPAFADIWKHYAFQRSSGPYDAYVPRTPF